MRDRDFLSDNEKRDDLPGIMMPDNNNDGDVYDDNDDWEEEDSSPWIKPRLFLFIGGIIVVILILIFILTGGSGSSEVTIDRIHNIEMRIAQLEGKISSFTDLTNRVSALENKTTYPVSASTPEAIRSMHSIDKRIEKLENDILKLGSTSVATPAASSTTADRQVSSAPPASQPQTVRADKTVYHTVKSGETLYGIARNYGVSVATIQKLNKLPNSSIKIGQRLIVKQ